jgi:hypothetical protein
MKKLERFSSRMCKKLFFCLTQYVRMISQFLSRRPFNFLCYRMRISSLTIGQIVCRKIVTSVQKNCSQVGRYFTNAVRFLVGML